MRSIDAPTDGAGASGCSAHRRRPPVVLVDVARRRMPPNRGYQSHSLTRSLVTPAPSTCLSLPPASAFQLHSTIRRPPASTFPRASNTSLSLSLICGQRTCSQILFFFEGSDLFKFNATIRENKLERRTLRVSCQKKRAFLGFQVANM